MIGVKKWAVRFFAAVVLLSAFLPFLDVATPKASAINETFEWNVTPAGYPEIRMRGGNFGDFNNLVRRDTISQPPSFLTFRPSPNAQQFSKKLISQDLQVATPRDADVDMCTVRLVIDIGNRPDQGQLSMDIVTPECMSGAGFTNISDISRPLFQRDYANGQGVESERRSINIGSAQALNEMTPNFADRFSECNAGNAEAFNNCINEGASGGEEGKGDDEPVCTGGAIGWILCPLIELASSGFQALVDLIQGLMTVQPLNITNPSEEPIYSVWNAMRNIANVLFIVMFLVIIISYITSYGISNYGIKRTLPRLIIAVILVNLSYFISALFIDIFNIIGASIEGLFRSGVTAATGESANAVQWGTFVIASIFGIGAAGVAFAAALSAFGPGILLLILPPLIGALITLLTLGAVLLVRQLAITIFVVISPIIAVLWLLPGTEQYFRRALRLFLSLLLSYPLVMVVLQSSIFVMAIIRQNGVAPNINGGGPNEWLSSLSLLVVLIVVVLIAISLIRSSNQITNAVSSKAGAALGWLGGLGSRQAKTAYSRSGAAAAWKARNAAKDARGQARFDQRRISALQGPADSRRLRGRFQRITRARAAESAAAQNLAQERQIAETRHVAEQLQGDRAYAERFAGTTDPARLAAAQARGIEAQRKQREQEIGAAKTALSGDTSLGIPELQAIARGDATLPNGAQNSYDALIYRQAALQKAREIGDPDTANAFASNPDNFKSEEQRNEFISEIDNNRGAWRSTSPALISNSVQNAIKSGQKVDDKLLNQGMKEVLASGDLKASELASLGTGELKRVKGALSDFEQEAARLQRLEDDLVRNGQAGSQEHKDVQNEYLRVQGNIEKTKELAGRALSTGTVSSGAKQKIVDELQNIKEGRFNNNP